MVDHPHLHLRKLGTSSKEFSPFGGGSTIYPAPVQDRLRHALKLRRQLDSAIEAFSQVSDLQAESGIELKRRGIALSATARKGEPLRVGTIKLNSRGLELLSLKRSPGKRDVAVMFATKSQILGLQRALDKYGEWRSGDRPRRFSLFESMRDFQIATVADLWTDDDDKLPNPDEAAEWEVWVRLDARAVVNRVLKRLDLKSVGQPTEFRDTLIYNVVATSEDIDLLVRASAAVVELRSASSFVSDYLDFDPEERATALAQVTALVTQAPANSPLTTLLDTGVNHANPLVGVALDAEDCLAIEANWQTNDHHGHGTQMAGIALYGDLERKISDGLPIPLTTRLESIVVAAPDGAAPIPARDALERAIELVGRDKRRRVLCLAQTAREDLSDGRQSASSGIVDRAAWNNGKKTRLICVAAGNAQANVDKRFPIGPYDQRNADYRLESPGQAVNALTVGAATHRCSDEWDGVAPAGDLCPSSRTSQQWDIHYAYKPDIVMEGGNHAMIEDEPFSVQRPETMLLTASRNYPTHPFGWTGETSAATAEAAGLATRLQAAYPEFRAETLRGMMVHAARWSPAMEARRAELGQLGLSPADAVENMLQCYGWGIPDEARLFRSAGDALTLVVEDKLQPYGQGKSGTVLHEMKYFVLPWPKQILEQLGQTEVELRCTLSYFAEPDPHAASRSRWDRYPSHRLRFAVKLPNDTHLEAQQRINKYASEEDVEDLDDDVSFGLSGGADEGWLLGDRKRRRGTIHHDIWTGKAFELAKRDGISVYPVKGWWGDQRDTAYHGVNVPFSLIVSIHTPATGQDIFAEAKAKVKTGNLVAATSIAT